MWEQKIWENREESTMKKKKIIPILVVAILVIGAVSNLGSKKDEETQKTNTSTNASKEESTEDVQNEESEISISDLLTCPSFTAEPKTSAMVDQIASTAKDHASELTDDQANQIIEIIKNADHHFYNGPEEMEKYMWYGYLLDYKYDDSDPRSELGMDLYQAIKYVYRGAENVTDDATKENLDQIDDDLSRIN